MSLVSLSACGSEDRSHASQTRLLASIEQAVIFGRDLRLEENEAVINVSPRVTVDHGGGFLVADALEQQLRIYAPDGRLVRHFGRRGSGPGEFQNLSAAVRLSDGTILAGDFSGRLTRFDSTGTQVLRTDRSGLGPIYEMLTLGDSVVVIIGRKGGQMQSPLVHEWDLAPGRIRRSFFSAFPRLKVRRGSPQHTRSPASPPPPSAATL
ncbi:MAG TPA: 6-bladed beta-propeller [Longimicrobium sp.]|nr:6-bladed beta-propeller [Longimicrobium sp.]